MKRWALLALLTPASALAGPFTQADALLGVDVDVSYTWNLPGGSVGPFAATFSFGNPSSFTSSRHQLCDDVTASPYCFTGTFTTSNSGFGTYQSTAQLDADSCVYGTETGYGSAGYFKTSTATCELVQKVEVTFANTGVAYTLDAHVLNFTYEAVYNYRGGNLRRRGQKASSSTAILATIPVLSFDPGTMSGISGGSVVSGSFVEI